MSFDKPAGGAGIDREPVEGDPSVHPALLRGGEYIPTPLTLVIPSRLGPIATLREMARAVQETRNHFRVQAARCKADCDRAQAGGDELRQAFRHGMTTTWSGAAEHIDHALCERFDVFGQAETPPSREVAIATARQLGKDVDRPEFPLPETGGMAGRLLALLCGQREQFVSLAVLERSMAQEWLEGTIEVGGDLDQCVPYYTHYERAVTWAMAADRIDAVLADAFGVTAEHQTFLGMHGPWLGLIA